MEITIDKSKFEEILPVAETCSEEVFDSFVFKFNATVEDVAIEVLGSCGESAASSEDHKGLKEHFIRYCVIRAFREQLAQRDVVLTSTGFGVVSNDSVAPASRDRVEAVNEQLLADEEMERGRLIICLTKVSDWGKTPQAFFCISRVIFSLAQYRRLSRQITSGSRWSEIQPLIDKADLILRENVGERVMAHLLQNLRDGISDEYGVVLNYCQNLTLAVINGDELGVSLWKRRVVALLESNVEEYPLYAESEVYKSRHVESYENRKEDPCFFF